jgi:hypothetical protein
MKAVQIETNFYYDPQRQGYDTALWKTLSGTPTISGDKLRISNAEIVHYGDIFRGFLNMAMNVPATPTSALLTGGTSATAVIATWNAVTEGEFAITLEGTARNITGLDFSACADMAAVAAVIQAGIRAVTGDAFTTVVWSTNKFIITSRISITVTSAVSGGTGTDISGAGGTAFMDSEVGRGTVTAATNSNKIFGLYQLNKDLRCYFHLRGNTLVAVTSDLSGNVQETDIAWVSAWTAADIKYEIDYTGEGVKFKVNGNHYAYHETRRPQGVMSIYINNSLADNFDMLYLEAKAVESYV